MKILASLIQRRLEAQVAEWGHCAVYEHELQRLWPLSEKNRKAKIAKFAKEYGFRLSFYKPGLCAIFEREPPHPQPVGRSFESPGLAMQLTAGRHAFDVETHEQPGDFKEL